MREERFLWELAKICDAATGLDDLAGACDAFMRRYELDHYVLAILLPTSLAKPYMVVRNNQPREWLLRYRDARLWRVDPVLRHARRSTRPITWIETRNLPGGKDPAVRQFWEEVRANGFRAGFSIPMHRARGEVTFLNMSTRHSKGARARIERAMLDATFLAHWVHDAACRMRDAGLLGPTPVQLTRREKEVLLWAAEGKSRDETATILGITPRTVQYHLEHAAEKICGGGSKTLVVARAMAQGIISGMQDGILLDMPRVGSRGS